MPHAKPGTVTDALMRNPQDPRLADMIEATLRAAGPVPH